MRSSRSIDAARATIDVDQANLTFADQDDKRYVSLAATGYGSVQNAQQAASRSAAARAAVARDTGRARDRDPAGRRPEGRTGRGAGDARA